jgi:hypothetical protein
MLALLLSLTIVATAAPPSDPPLAAAATRARAALLARYGEAQRSRIDRGLAQVVLSWRPDDGPPAALEALAL